MPATVISLLKYVHRFHRRLKNVTRFYQCNSHVCSYTDNVIAEEILLSLITPRTLSQRERGLLKLRESFIYVISL